MGLLETLEDQYYEPSTALTVRGCFFTLAVACCSAVPLSALYAFLILYCQVIQLTFLAAIGFGFALGFITAWSMQISKLRLPRVTIILGTVISICGIYGAWVFWIFGWYHHFGKQLWAISPNDLWREIEHAAYVGPYTLFGSLPSVATWYALWAGEACLIIGSCVVACRKHAQHLRAKDGRLIDGDSKAIEI